MLLCLNFEKSLSRKETHGLFFFKTVTNEVLGDFVASFDI